MEKRDPNNRWFYNVIDDEPRFAAEALSVSLHGNGLSNVGLLTISSGLYEEEQLGHSGEYRRQPLVGIWEQLSDNDKTFVRQYYIDHISHPLAPNGKRSNLSKEDWVFVREPQFIAWFGEWRFDRANSSIVLDENGEPLVVWHGSNKEFDSFDLSRGGSMTGAEDWVDKESGKTIASDAKKGAYFSSYRPQAVSYAFLARFYEYEKIKCAYEGLYPCVNSLKNYSFRDRQAFIDAMRLTAPLSPSIARLLERVEESPDKFILKEIIPTLTIEERRVLSDEIESGRNRYRELYRSMDNGQMSNEYNNYFRQDAILANFKANLIRLYSNDMTVQNEFGTFETHSFGIMAGGNDVLLFFFDDNKRCVVNDPRQKGSSVFLDQCSFNDLVGVLDRIDEYHARFAKRLNQDITSNDYNQHVTIYKAFLNIRNPLSHDYEHSAFPDVYKKTKWPTSYVAARQVDKALRDGNDGVVYRNIQDPFNADTYGAFSSQQIMIIGKKHDLRVGEVASTGQAETKAEKRVRPTKETALQRLEKSKEAEQKALERKPAPKPANGLLQKKR